MSVAVVLVAAGIGRRLGDEGPKALVHLAGRPLLDHALERVARLEPAEIVVVATPGEEERFEAIADRHEIGRVVTGGATRTASVRAGVAALGTDADVVAIHDAARALTPPAVLRAAVAAVRDGAIAAAPAMPVSDTLKRAQDGEVLGTIDRAGLHAVQTPQVFARPVLEEVLSDAGDGATDDLALVEAARDAGRVDGRIRLVPGSRWGMKITYPEDLVIAASLVREGPP